MGYRGKVEEQQQARRLRAQAWTLQEIAACEAWEREQVGILSDRDLLIAGAVLYAGEGRKGDGHVASPTPTPR